MESVSTFVLSDGTRLITNFFRSGPPNYDEWWMSKNTAVEEERVTDLKITIPPSTVMGTFRPVPIFQFVGNHFSNLEWCEVDAITDKGRVEKVKMFKIAPGKTMFSAEADVYDMEPFFELSDGIQFGDLIAKRLEGWITRKNSQFEKEREELKKQMIASQKAAQLKSDEAISALKSQLAKANKALTEMQGKESSTILDSKNVDLIEKKISDIQEDLLFFRTVILSGQIAPQKSARVAPYEKPVKEAGNETESQEKGSCSPVVRPHQGGGPNRRGGGGRGSGIYVMKP